MLSDTVAVKLAAKVIVCVPAVAAATKVAKAAAVPVNVVIFTALTTPVLFELMPFNIEASNELSVAVSLTTPVCVKNLPVACVALITRVEPATSWKVSILVVVNPVTSKVVAVFSINVTFNPLDTSEVMTVAPLN